MTSSSHRSSFSPDQSCHSRPDASIRSSAAAASTSAPPTPRQPHPLHQHQRSRGLRFRASRERPQCDRLASIRASRRRDRVSCSAHRASQPAPDTTTTTTMAAATTSALSANTHSDMRKCPTRLASHRSSALKLVTSTSRRTAATRPMSTFSRPLICQPAAATTPPCTRHHRRPLLAAHKFKNLNCFYLSFFFFNFFQILCSFVYMVVFKFQIMHHFIRNSLFYFYFIFFFVSFFLLSPTS